MRSKQNQLDKSSTKEFDACRSAEEVLGAFVRENDMRKKLAALFLAASIMPSMASSTAPAPAPERPMLTQKFTIGKPRVMAQMSTPPTTVEACRCWKQPGATRSHCCSYYGGNCCE